MIKAACLFPSLSLFVFIWRMGLLSSGTAVRIKQVCVMLVVDRVWEVGPAWPIPPTGKVPQERLLGLPGPSTSLQTLVVATQPDGHLAGSSFLGDSVSLCVVGSVASPPKRPHEVHGFPSLCPLLESVPPPKTCSIHWVCLTSIFLQLLP